eukprot:TRINITY_DN10797_c0_g1_i1.p1 TRINITY_DN10797_c0_g1~~TRINITY_DN10797_c0_g1_i1.p1  ORF type:complete len:257 (+),score=33.46 TRINITY_DN10797_c0_g1_i1:65-835(+)
MAASKPLKLAMSAFVLFCPALVVAALILPWYYSSPQGNTQVSVSHSTHAFYVYSSCDDYGEDTICDQLCTGIHGWGSLMDKKCTEADKVYDGNMRTLYVFTWVFDLLALLVLVVLSALLFPSIRSQVMAKMPPRMHDATPIALASLAILLLALSFVCFWVFFSTAQCNDLMNFTHDVFPGVGIKKDDICENTGFWVSNDRVHSVPTFGWAFTITSFGLMVLAVVAMILLVKMERTEGENTPLTPGAGGSASWFTYV